MISRRILLALVSVALAALSLPPLLFSQAPDSARYRIYLTVTDSVTGKSAKAALGFHPRATLAVDQDTLFGFTDHWYESDQPWMLEYPSPPLGFFEELRVNNVRQKFVDNGLLFGNIHAYTGPSMVDTFIITFNGDQNSIGDSLYLYTHPQILSWPSVLRFYADSIILRDISNNGQTIAGPYVRVNMTTDSTFHYFGDTYFNPDFSIWNVDPLHKGFFMFVYHPKPAPGPPGPVTLLSPANGSTGIALNGDLLWNAAAGASYYKVELDTIRTFPHPVVTDQTPSTTEPVSGLSPNTWYYWRVLVSNPYGVSYYQDPPDSFMTTSSSGVHENGGGVPRSFGLFQNYPNPFNPSTSIDFQIPRAALVRITVYDALGRSVATLVEGEFRMGFYTAVWNGADAHGSAVPSGIYFARMVADPQGSDGLPGMRVESMVRMVLLK
jgi:flagellar hook capping protein FlgD